jgi:hypothetical protein
MLGLEAGVPRQKAIHFIDEDDRRAAFLGPGEQISQLLHRCARGASEDVGSRHGIEAPLGLRGDQPRDHRLASARRSDQDQARRHGQLQPFAVGWIHQPNQRPKIRLRVRRQNHIVPIDLFEGGPVKR